MDSWCHSGAGLSGVGAFPRNRRSLQAPVRPDRIRDAATAVAELLEHEAGVEKLAPRGASALSSLAAQPSGECQGGTISTAAMFQRSVVGAVSLICTTEPAADVGEFRACTQYVSPIAVSSHSWTIDCPEPGVR